MKAAVKKWGNSPAVHIPKSVMEATKLSVNDLIEIRAENGLIIIEPIKKSYALAQLLNEITAENIHSEIDFGDAVGKESW